MQQNDDTFDLTQLWEDKHNNCNELFKSCADDFETHCYPDQGGEFECLLMYSKRHGASKRPAQYKKCEDLSKFSVSQPFDDSKFNFAKASTEEDMANADEATVKINVSPVFETHSLLIPFLQKKVAQFISHPNILQTVLDFYHFEQKHPENYMIGFNSAGASSSMNHLHFQMIDLDLIKKKHQVTKQVYGEWHIKNAGVTKVKASKETGFEVKVCNSVPEGAILNNAIVLKWAEQPEAVGSNIDTKYIAEQIYSVLTKLHECSMPYNLQIHNSSVIIFPRLHQSCAPNPTQFAPALFEFFGFFRITSQAQWDKGLKECYESACADLKFFTDFSKLSVKF